MLFTDKVYFWINHNFRHERIFFLELCSPFKGRENFRIYFPPQSPLSRMERIDHGAEIYRPDDQNIYVASNRFRRPRN